MVSRLGLERRLVDDSARLAYTRGMTIHIELIAPEAATQSLHAAIEQEGPAL